MPISVTDKSHSLSYLTALLELALFIFQVWSMTKLLLFLSLVFSNPIISVPPHASILPPPLRGGGRLGAVLPIADPTCYTFTVDNTSSYSLGTVTVSGTGSSANFNVTTSGFYQQEICFTAISVTVAGTSVAYPNSSVVDIGSGTLVSVVWQSTSVVEIADKDEIGSPQP